MGKLLAMAALLAALLGADEGMWLFTNPPRRQVQQKYGVALDDVYLRHMQQASVRFTNGGSGSFVSPQGLIFTNHHVGADCIQKLSSAEHDYLRDGFYAVTEAGELPCPDLELNVLVRQQDVTDTVRSAGAGKPVAEANRVRKTVTARLEQECVSATGHRCDVVTLFSGGQYQLYEYEKYTDVRLVFAPEGQIADFGGDPDNFNYPRYSMDFALFRAYKNGRPVKPLAYFPWSKQGVRNRQLTFVPGHPGSTARMATVAELEFYRDVQYPLILKRFASLSEDLQRYSRSNAEDGRVAQDQLESAQNSVKAYTGFLAGLQDARLMAQKSQEEAALRGKVQADAEMQKEYGGAWDALAEAYRQFAPSYPRYYVLEVAGSNASELLRIARQMLRYSSETAKPESERLREYADSALPIVEQRIYSPAAITSQSEIVMLANYFAFLRQQLGGSDPLTQSVLQGREPRQAAEYYVRGTNLFDVETRRQLVRDADALNRSTDHMIQLVRLLEKPARNLRKEYEARVEAVAAVSAASVAQARLAAYGSDVYPDATFTLRLAYGPVRGYETRTGTAVPYATRFSGLYSRATGADPYRLPQRWQQARPKLDLQTAFNFVTTADTHGGNSGSPTLNTKGEIVGIVFDGNSGSLPNRFFYTDQVARTVHLSSQAVVEALRKIYRANRILQELGIPE